MINTLLLDLDGTLSNMDTKLFTKSYLLALGKKMSHLVDLDSFFSQIMASTEVMINNCEAERTNLEVFLENFSARTGIGEERLWSLFIDFYTNDFHNYGKLVMPNPFSTSLVEEAHKKGYQIAIACNPIMPKVAIEQRIKWAGLELKGLSLIPSIEEMHFCKPNSEFFLELLKILGKQPQECLMVGNDVKEDLVAGETGIKTYLVTDNYRQDVISDYQGDLATLLNLIKGNKI